MKNKYLHITTPCGTHYTCLMSNGNVVRHGNNKWPEDHSSWKIAGLERIKAFNRLEFIPLERVPELLQSGEDLRFKNGKPRFTVRDLDHGTTRIWGNWKWHGVGSIWLSDSL
jgi:hypothetical protein